MLTKLFTLFAFLVLSIIVTVSLLPLQFLTERFYNSPRPFYGYPEASWTRVISASANVMSRISVLFVDWIKARINLSKKIKIVCNVSQDFCIYSRGIKIWFSKNSGGKPYSL